ncbi:PREDICTED: uncharacterized protein LOC109230324 [Nicotiana attenuata]|uniref:uncharacterized protein LOC109230324 n=1 Tax=Nicotiana attenuata TaxID=49451 RepID=UPI00090577FF|nr:PREDICTED: uncharacterized protein LOC109230324 [Nicotiana attenuata]
MNNVAPELLGGVVYASNAYLVWEDLRERFNKELWHEYDVLVPFSNCYEKSKEHAENLHQQRVMQFLSGLNESYDQARRQILMKTNVPSLNQTYDMIIQDESQQKIGVNAVTSDKIEPLAMQAGRGRGRRQYLQCDCCHLKGHTKENCYKIVGYPADYAPRRRYGEGIRTQGEWQQNSGTGNQNIWNGTTNGKGGWNNPNVGKQGGNGGNAGKPGGWRREPMAMINNADVSTSFMQDMGDGPSGVAEHKRYYYFTNDQYNHILNLLNKESHPESSMANMAGPGTSAEASEVKCLMSNFTQKSQEKEWVVDSSATHHITSDLELLSDVKCTKKTNKYRDLWNGKVMGIGKERGGLYVLRGLTNRINALNAVIKTSRDSSEVWHNRLGHPSASVMRHVVGLNNKNSEVSHENCLICPLAKQTRLKFPLSKSRTEISFHLLHMDLWGPCKIATLDKKHYFLTIVDDYSRYTWVFFLQLKSEAIVAIKSWYNLPKQLPLHFTAKWHSAEKAQATIKCSRGQNSIELLYHKNANIAHLRTICCLCYATNLVKTNKFAERAKAAILMGYSEIQKGYILLDLATKQFFTSRNVIFKESGFLFSKKDESRSYDSQEHMEKGILQFSPLHTQPGDNTFDGSETSQNIHNMDIVHACTQSDEHQGGAEISVNRQEDDGDEGISRPGRSTSYLARFSQLIEPQTFKEAVKDSRWIEAMKQKVNALEDNKTWEIVNLPEGKNTVGSKWVYKIKFKGDLNEEVYMELPEGFRRQGEQKWNIKLTEALLRAGFKQIHHDYSLFTLRSQEGIVIILVYVDDLLITGSSSTLVKKAKDILHQNFKNVGAYQRLVGRLLYVTITRPDINYVVQALSQFMQAPKRSHWDAALRVVRYLKIAPGQGMLMKSDYVETLAYWYDSDWAVCLNTRRSVTGYVIKFGDSMISLKSKKQQTVSRSSAEAEYMSIAASIAEVTWLLGLFKELGVNIIQPVTILSDSKSAIQLVANPVLHERTKHIEIDCLLFET